MFADWNHNGHRCPGPVREQQVRSVILPHVQGTAPAPTPPPPPTPAAANSLNDLARNLAYCKLFVVGPGNNVSPMAVTFVQWGLQRAGIPVTADGVWGPATEAGVRYFQKTHRLPTDGLVGPKTWALLYP